jgi:hypothetical protein
MEREHSMSLLPDLVRIPHLSLKFLGQLSGAHSSSGPSQTPGRDIGFEREGQVWWFDE